MNILLRLAFCGSRYHGFQVQKNALSVCEVLQNGLEKVLGSRPAVKGCSRTDAGVHARDFALSFFADTVIPLHKLPLALNNSLPEDIRVFSACQVPEGFHARYSCSGKEYHYQILNAMVDDPFTPHLHHRIIGRLDETAMNAAALHLLGRHDFSAFMAAGSDVEDRARTISRCEVTRQGPRLTIAVAADGFLYNMVRIIAGTLVLVGQGKLTPAMMPRIIEGRSREAAGPTLPAQGLFLNRVFYPDDAFALPPAFQ